MSVSPTERKPVPLREHIAEEIRVLLTRQRTTGVALAARIGRSQSYVSRRLTGETAFDVDDIERIALVLGVPVQDLMPRDAGSVTRRKPTSTRPMSPVSHTSPPGPRRPRRLTPALAA